MKKPEDIMKYMPMSPEEMLLELRMLSAQSERFVAQIQSMSMKKSSSVRSLVDHSQSGARRGNRRSP